MATKRVAVLFSGGLDSTAVAVHHLRTGYVVDLLTFSNGTQKWLELAEYKGAFLIDEFPKQCIWRLIDCTFLFHELAIKHLESDVKKYGNLICCGCKISMLSEAIIHCRRNDICEIMDGFKKTQDFYPEQTKAYMDATQEFAEEFKVSYSHPFYETTNLDFEDMALSGSVPPSPMQPYCIFERHPVNTTTSIEEYVRNKLELAREYVSRRLQDHNTFINQDNQKQIRSQNLE